MKRLIKTVTVLGSSQMACTAVAIVRNKLLACVLGPAGIGLFSQLQQVQGFASSVIPLGMQQGALKYLAAHRANDPKLVPRYVATASKTFFALSILTVTVCLALVKPLAAITLDKVEWFVYLIPPLLGVPFLIQTQIWQTYLQAGLEIKKYSSVLVINSVLSLIIAVPLVLIWKQAGAAVHLLVFAFLGYAVARLVATRSMGKKVRVEIKAAKFDPQVLRNLVRFAGANLPVFLLMLGQPLLMRTQIVNDLGFHDNGIFQALYALSSQYLMIPVNALGTYTFPRISQLTDIKQINAEVNSYVKLILLINTFAILMVLGVRDVMISVLYSPKFLAATVLFPWQMIGDLMRSVFFSIQTPTIVQERFRARTIMFLIQTSIFFGVFYAMPHGQRLWGAVYGHAASWGAMMVMAYGYTHWLNGFTLTRGNLRLLIQSIVAVCVVAFLPFQQPAWRAAGFGIAALWVAVSVSREEWAKLFGLLSKRLRTTQA